MSDAYLNRAAIAWAKGSDTYAISKLIRRRESLIYAWLEVIKARACVWRGEMAA